MQSLETINFHFNEIILLDPLNKLSSNNTCFTHYQWSHQSYKNSSSAVTTAPKLHIPLSLHIHRSQIDGDALTPREIPRIKSSPPLEKKSATYTFSLPHPVDLRSRVAQDSLPSSFFLSLAKIPISRRRHPGRCVFRRRRGIFVLSSLPPKLRHTHITHSPPFARNPQRSLSISHGEKLSLWLPNNRRGGYVESSSFLYREKRGGEAKVARRKVLLVRSFLTCV